MLYNRADGDVSVILPQWTTGNIILYGSLSLLVLFVAPLEYNGLSMMRYGKFRPVRGMPTRWGMFLLYFSPLIALTVSALPYLSAPTVIQVLVFGAVFIHFAKRLLESLFLHKYSGPMGLLTALMIGCFYSFVAFLIGYLNRQPLQNMDAGFVAGIVLFVVGIFGNFTHHKILADLRRNSSAYILPGGGLFEWVACPHYLFEIIIWLGIALLSRHLASFLALGFVIAYLSARSLRTLQWYRQRFPNFPPDRKAMIPFIL